MINSFKEHFDYSPQEFKELWDNGIFCLDANVLLNFYRYSDKAREDLAEVLSSLGNRLWIPHRAAFEFFNRRCCMNQPPNYSRGARKRGPAARRYLQ